MQKRAAKAECTQGLCNRADCKQVMQHGIAIGRGARRGAKRDAQRRDARGGCKKVLQKWGFMAVFAIGRVARKRCNMELQ